MGLQMSDIQIPDDSFINSIIGEGTRFKGDFELNGLLRIDGDFSGTIHSNGKILVGRNGRAECTIHAGTVVIGGIVRGNVFTSEKVIILSTGMMLGNITTPRLIAEEGVIFNGNCRIELAGVESAFEEKEKERKPFTPPSEAAEKTSKTAVKESSESTKESPAGSPAKSPAKSPPKPPSETASEPSQASLEDQTSLFAQDKAK